MPGGLPGGKASSARSKKAFHTSAALREVKWRFLSEAATGPIAPPQQAPHNDEARHRIAFLERALASTHDLEAQYQSFLQEVSKSDPNGKTFSQAAFSGGVAGPFNPLAVPEGAEDDNIPSDPIDLPLPDRLSLEEGGNHAAEDEEVQRVQQQSGGDAEGGGAGDAEGGDEMRNSPSPVTPLLRHPSPPPPRRHAWPHRAPRCWSR